MRLNTKRISNTMILSAVVVGLLMMLATELVLRQVRREEIQEAGEIQQNALKLFWELVQVRGKGFGVRDGKLMAGGYTFNGNNELPDKVKEITGSCATVFLGDTRIATNVRLSDGQRALGTKLTGPVREAVLVRGVPFRGEAQVMGSTYYTAYDPIRDRDGRVIGALFTGSRQSEYLAAYNRSAARIRAINGALTCIFIVCAVLLLAERKRSEEAVQRQLQFLQTIIDAIPSPIFYKNLKGNYLGCNEEYQKVLGLGRDQIIGRTVHDLWEKSLAQRYHQMDQELFQKGGTQVYESSVRYADGSLHDVLFTKAVFRDEDSAITGLVGVMLDITQRKAAEDAARDAYRRIADILEFLPDATFVVDQAGCVIAWNRAMEAMTGVPKEQMLGRGDQAYAVPFYGERRKILIDLLDQEPQEDPAWYPGMEREGRSVFAEKKLILRGEERFLWGVAAPLYDRQGTRVGGIQTLRDVTELRRAEKERSTLEARLRHSGILESLMVQLGHDLKTPLTPLFALLPLVRREVRAPHLEKMVDICQGCATQIQGLTTKALDLVRLSARQGTPQLVPVTLAAVAQRALDRSAGLFSRRGITCSNAIDAGVSVKGAEEQLDLLFDNLLSNAARFAATQGAVRIAASRQEGSVLVSVQDDGIGLDPGHKRLIFQEFFKADAARHDLGTQGLGLAISKSIVIKHGGEIWAESPGKDLGTTIFFTLEPAEAA